jgi:hypothetical protein
VASFEVNAGSLPKGAREFAPRYRFLGDQTWIDLPREKSPRFTIDVLREKGVGEERFDLDVRAVSNSGIVAPRGRRISLRTDAPITDIDDPVDLTLPVPKILQEDAALSITPDKPFGELEGAYEIEVRHSIDGDNPEDAVFVGYVEPGDTVKDYAWSDTEDQQIHTRPIRKEDNKAGAWTTTDFKVSSAADTDTEDFDADFSTGTLEGIGTSSVAALANVVASGVEFVTTITLDSFGSTTLDQLGTASLDMVDGTPSQGTWTSPVYELSDPQPFQLEIKPEKDTITRQTKTLDDLGAEPLCPPPTLAGVAQDNRLRDSSFVLDGDEYPIVVETKIAVSDATGPTFVDADFIEAVPGRIYKPLAYAIRFTLFTRFLTQFRLTRIRIRRFLICHCSKKVLKFHITEGTHGFSVGDVVYVNASGTWATAISTAIGTAADGIVVEVPNANSAVVALAGLVRWAAHGLTVGSLYYLSETVAGALTTTVPTTSGDVAQPILTPSDADHVIINVGGAQIVP